MDLYEANVSSSDPPTFVDETAMTCDVSGPLSTPLIVLAYALYGSVFVAALLGNGLVCYTVVASPRMRTSTNLFLLNLAIGDLLMTIFCVPFTFVPVLILQYWPFGSFFCPTVGFVQATCVLVSAYTLLAVSIDRYTAVRWPLKPRLRKSSAKAVMLCIWGGATATAAPLALTTGLEQPHPWYERCGRYMCHERWAHDSYRYVYGMALLALQYVLPLAVLILTYTLIALLVWGKRTPGEAHDQRDQRLACSKRKMIKMMVLVVIVFTVCWLPFNILMTVADHVSSLPAWRGLPYVWWACHWLAMSHCCYNPLIYCWLNARFRVGFTRALQHLPCPPLWSDHKRPRPSSSTCNVGSSVNFELHRAGTCSSYVSGRQKLNSFRASRCKRIDSDNEAQI